MGNEVTTQGGWVVSDIAAIRMNTIEQMQVAPHDVYDQNYELIAFTKISDIEVRVLVSESQAHLQKVMRTVATAIAEWESGKRPGSFAHHAASDCYMTAVDPNDPMAGNRPMTPEEMAAMAEGASGE